MSPPPADRVPDPAAPLGAAPTTGGVPGRLPTGTLVAAGVLVVVAARLLHEIIGHGLPCLLGGGEWRGFSSSWTVCADEGMSSGTRLVQLAGGTLVQLVAGIGALAWLALRPPGRGLTYAALWQFAAVNLFLATGPLMIDPITGAHEWRDVLRVHLTHPAWRWGATALGVLLTVGGYILLLRLLEPLLATEPTRRRAIVRALAWGPFLVGVGLVLSLASWRNVLGMEAAYDAIMTAFGATSFLFWIPFSTSATAPSTPPRRTCTPIARSAPLVGTAAAIAVLTIWLLGPGVPLPY